MYREREKERERERFDSGFAPAKICTNNPKMIIAR